MQKDIRQRSSEAKENDVNSNADVSRVMEQVTTNRAKKVQKLRQGDADELDKIATKTKRLRANDDMKHSQREATQAI